MPEMPIASRRLIPLAGAAVGLAIGLAAWWLENSAFATVAWTVATVPALVALVVEIITTFRRGEMGLDILAALSMSGALILGETLAANVVALMYAGGQALESFAEQRATRSLTALLSRVPQTALVEINGLLSEVPIKTIEAGARLFIRRGDAVPVDGRVAEGRATLDQSALTGESIPVLREVGASVMSGSTNAGDAFRLIATRRAAESSYAGIVRLVEAARANKAPMSRLADRFALGFLALTLLLAGAAWLGSGDPVRALAVLVVATPCPLILAVPVAIISGVSRAARLGVLVKGGTALERLATVRSLVVDKTGTLTYGRPQLLSTEPVPDLTETDVLRLAASLDQASPHAIAEAIVAGARAQGIELLTPEIVEKSAGEGLKGTVCGRTVIVGGRRYVSRQTQGVVLLDTKPRPGTATVLVTVDGRLAGVLTLADELRRDARELVLALRRLGIERFVVASGDRSDVTNAIGAALGADAIYAELTPTQKVDVVKQERQHAGPVMMVGDGVNDAPALAAADLGMAMGAEGAAASAEAADIVLLVDDLHRILPAIRIARRSRAIALQSVIVGIGLSSLGMVAAAFGHLTPVQGALLQEAIDVAVILNALRALSGARRKLGQPDDRPNPTTLVDAPTG